MGLVQLLSQFCDGGLFDYGWHSWDGSQVSQLTDRQLDAFLVLQGSQIDYWEGSQIDYLLKICALAIQKIQK